MTARIGEQRRPRPADRRRPPSGAPSDRSLRGAVVLVTGGAGAVGSTIVDRLLAGGAAQVRVLDSLVRGSTENLRDALLDPRVELVVGDIQDVDLVHDLVRGSDLVFHQAALRIGDCTREPRLALGVLVDGTFTVLEAAAQHRVRKVVAASSAAIYGAIPTRADGHHRTDDSFYGAAKSFNEAMLRSFRATHDLAYVALRTFDVYGPRMDVHGPHSEVLIRWMERIEAGLPPLITGGGRHTMDFVYTTDVARANLLAAVSDVTDGVYQVSSGVKSSLTDLAHALLQAMDSDLRLELPAERTVVPRLLAPAATAERDLGFRPQVRLDEGLRELVRWWRSAQPARSAPAG